MKKSIKDWLSFINRCLLVIFSFASIICFADTQTFRTRIKCELQTASPTSLPNLRMIQGQTPLISADQYESGRAVDANTNAVAILRFAPSLTNTVWVSVTNQTYSGNSYLIQCPSIGTNAVNWVYTVLYQLNGATYWSGAGRLDIEKSDVTGSNLVWQTIEQNAVTTNQVNDLIATHNASASSHPDKVTTADTNGWVVSAHDAWITAPTATGIVDNAVSVHNVSTASHPDKLATNDATYIETVSKASTALQAEADTLATVAARGNFLGTEEITPLRVNTKMIGMYSGDSASGDYWGAYGLYAGVSATGDYWGAYGLYAGYSSTGNQFGAYGAYAGLSATGDYWGAYGNTAGNYATGDYWGAYGFFTGYYATWTNSVALGNYAGVYATGNNRLYIDVLQDYPGTNYNPQLESMIYGDNGQLNLGRTGALTNASPNVLRGAWTASNFALNGTNLQSALNEKTSTNDVISLIGEYGGGVSESTVTNIVEYFADCSTICTGKWYQVPIQTADSAVYSAAGGGWSMRVYTNMSSYLGFTVPMPREQAATNLITRFPIRAPANVDGHSVTLAITLVDWGLVATPSAVNKTTSVFSAGPANHYLYVTNSFVFGAASFIRGQALNVGASTTCPSSSAAAYVFAPQVMWVK